jgi:hypothetical protein
VPKYTPTAMKISNGSSTQRIGAPIMSAAQTPRMGMMNSSENYVSMGSKMSGMMGGESKM